MRRCGFFFDVFGLELPEYITCKYSTKKIVMKSHLKSFFCSGKIFSDSDNSEECVGGKEVRELKNQKPICNEFLCDKKR